MLKLLPKLLLLVALLAALLASSAPVFAGGCHFDNTINQCVNNGCTGFCLGFADKCHCSNKPF